MLRSAMSTLDIITTFQTYSHHDETIGYTHPSRKSPNVIVISKPANIAGTYGYVTGGSVFVTRLNIALMPLTHICTSTTTGAIRSKKKKMPHVRHRNKCRDENCDN